MTIRNGLGVQFSSILIPVISKIINFEPILVKKTYSYSYSYDFFLHEKSLFLSFLPGFQVKPLVWLDSPRFFMQIRVVDMSNRQKHVRFMTIFVFHKKVPSMSMSMFFRFPRSGMDLGRIWDGLGDVRGSFWGGFR